MEKKTDLRIDAVAETRRIRDAQHEHLDGQPWEARVAFFRERAAALSESLREAGKLARD
ncbi:MAG: hypothetical protein AAF594_10355 [Bacteroidota bacterium]